MTHKNFLSSSCASAIQLNIITFVAGSNYLFIKNKATTMSRGLMN